MLLPVNLTLTPQRLARGRASLRCSSRFLTRILAGAKPTPHDARTLRAYLP